MYPINPKVSETNCFENYLVLETYCFEFYFLRKQSCGIIKLPIVITDNYTDPENVFILDLSLTGKVNNKKPVQKSPMTRKAKTIRVSLF